MRDESARGLAVRILSGDRPGGRFVGERLDEALRKSQLNPADRRLATELVYGVMRRRSAVDALLAPFVERQPLPSVWNILRIASYQLAFLDNIPAHAALDTAVELAPKQRDRGFINAVLRSVTRLLTDEIVDGPKSTALPLFNGRYRNLTQAVLPEKPAQYLATAFTLPHWLAQRWIDRYGRDECLRLGFWFANTPTVWLRTNRLRIDRSELLAQLRAVDIDIAPGGDETAVELRSSAGMAALPGYDLGHFCVQDFSAQQVAAMLRPRPGWRVLDRCAAPGGKSTHVAELMDDRGQVVACDVEERKLATVRQLSNRLGLQSISTVCLGRYDDPPAGPFDAALVDAPCSNTGVIGRRPEVRWRLQIRDLTEMPPLQTRLLLESARRVRKGGVVVYSTCSIEPEENEAVVRAVQQKMRNLDLEEEVTAEPGKPADGGYRARLIVR